MGDRWRRRSACKWTAAQAVCGNDFDSDFRRGSGIIRTDCGHCVVPEVEGFVVDGDVNPNPLPITSDTERLSKQPKRHCLVPCNCIQMDGSPLSMLPFLRCLLPN